MPRLPVSMAAASDRMSPKMLPVTSVSKLRGLRMTCMAALSTYLSRRPCQARPGRQCQSACCRARSAGPHMWLRATSG